MQSKPGESKARGLPDPRRAAWKPTWLVALATPGIQTRSAAIATL
jgi:hypothetical protein